jgi:antirestriction protein
MGRLIIAFGYKRMRGKDTAASMTFENLSCRGFSVRTDAFAFSLKEMCRVVFGFSTEQLYGDLKGVEDPFWGFTPRWAMQYAGTEAMRKVIDNEIWVKTLIRRAQQDPSTSVLVTDLRFPNEAAAIKKMGGLLVKCHRNLGFNADMDSHISEIALDEFDGWDYELDNNGSMNALREQVDMMLDHMLMGEINDQDSAEGQAKGGTSHEEPGGEDQDSSSHE